MSSKTVLFILALLVAWIIIVYGLFMKNKEAVSDAGTPLQSFNSKFTSKKTPDNNIWVEQNFGDNKESISPNDALALSQRMAIQVTLRSLFTAQMIHLVEYGEFTEDLSELPVPINPGAYDITCNAGDEYFVIQATGNIDKDEHLDILLIDDEGQIYFIEDDLKDESYPYPF